ncbi:hypothetical protein [Halomicrobium salinisoli]|uniref:hypothetical protein n=1 Tax=Halomicrobium salinisoli TaxID=2878391 RepID=UPI001CF0661F|nr:hypothetical protein [Halomicrobium salinisoli]
MANRSEKVEFYVTPDTKREIERAAEKAEMTVSSWCASRIDEILHNDALEAKSQEYQAEQRIEELIARATDEIEAAAEELRETQVKSGVYSIATWELLKQDIDELQRQNALSDAAERVRDADQFDVGTDRSSSPEAGQTTTDSDETTPPTDTDSTGVAADTTDATDTTDDSEPDDGKWWDA